jgi:hypothetical protein
LKFNETVISLADETIPKTSTNPKRPGKPWFNDECKDAIKIAKRPNDGSENIQHRTTSAMFASSGRKLEEH